MRSPIAAAAAAGSRFSVTGSMSANTGRARSYSAALAEATNENGLVMTSSPSPTPTARRARCNPAVPLLTAHACAAPTRAANVARTRSRAARATAARSAAPRSPPAPPASPSTGRASGIDSVMPDPRELPADVRSADRGSVSHCTLPLEPSGDSEAVRRSPCMPYSSESTSASQEAAIRFSETPIEPHTSWPSEASISTRVTAPVPLRSSRMRTLKLTSSMSRRCGWISPIASRSARSSACTGPLPSAVRT